MSRNLFVGNLPFSIEERDLRELFESAGHVESVRLIVDRETRRNRGFGFVVMKSETDAEAAVSQLSGHRYGERELVVSAARPQMPRDAR